MCSREKNGYSIRWARNNRKKPDQYGISLNPEYGDTPDCTNLHMSLLHQSVLVIVILIPWLDLSDEKCETKEGSSCWELDPNPSLSPLFTEMNWSIHRILGRDWRGSNPQLPPWQGGALTDWTTIPGKLGVQLKNSFFFSLHSNHLVSPCCNRDTNDILYYSIE